MKTNAAKKIKSEKIEKPKKAKPAPKLLSVDERESQYRSLRLMVNNLYDIQRLRLQSEGRHNRKSGTEIQLAETEIEMLKANTAMIGNFEQSVLHDIKVQLRKMPFYRDWLKDFEGVGEVGAAIILSQFDIKIADTVSKMWAFAGLCPLPCRRCKACHNVVEKSGGDEFYTHASYSSFRSAKQAAEEKAKPCPMKTMDEADTYESGKAQKPVKGEKLKYNAWLRSKLVGAVGSAQITNGTRWRKLYDDYKHRKLTQGWGVSDGHRHAAAVRYMVKMMLLEIWKAWREYEGLPVRPSYHEEKQGGHGFHGR